eukprot:GFYU01016610.1.p1 GENE.GFYU01016610.1~~GFYU01016610.1.p1  ORF type:complete len:368 (+),score=103.11 GFYU01016610.1:102-1106(+)
MVTVNDVPAAEAKGTVQRVKKGVVDLLQSINEENEHLKHMSRDDIGSSDFYGVKREILACRKSLEQVKLDLCNSMEEKLKSSSPSIGSYEFQEFLHSLSKHDRIQTLRERILELELTAANTEYRDSNGSHRDSMHSLMSQSHLESSAAIDLRPPTVEAASFGSDKSEAIEDLYGIIAVLRSRLQLLESTSQMMSQKLVQQEQSMTEMISMNDTQAVEISTLKSKLAAATGDEDSVASTPVELQTPASPTVGDAAVSAAVATQAAGVACDSPQVGGKKAAIAKKEKVVPTEEAFRELVKMLGVASVVGPIDREMSAKYAALVLLFWCMVVFVSVF